MSATTMRALVKYPDEHGLRMETVPVPEVSSGEVLIKVSHSAICGTDIHIWNWDEWAQATVPAPMIIGHEFCGVVEQIGAEVEGVEPGQRVLAEGHVTCGVCRNCRAGRRHLCREAEGIGVHRSGSFAEYVVVPAVNVFRIPDDISDTLGAIFDPLGNAVHTALSFDLVGEDVLITGAGPIGIMGAAVARHAGARHVVITDINEQRLALAAKAPQVTTVNVATQSLEDTMTELGMTEGFDVGLEMSGNGLAFRQMVEAMNHGGKLALLGIFPDEVGLDWSKVLFKGLQLKGIYGREIFETWYKMVSMIQSGLKVEHVITDVLPIERFEYGFEMMRAGEAAKVVLEW